MISMALKGQYKTTIAGFVLRSGVDDAHNATWAGRDAAAFIFGLGKFRRRSVGRGEILGPREIEREREMVE